MQSFIALQRGSFGRRGRELKLSYGYKNTRFQAVFSFAWAGCLLLTALSIAKKVKRAFNC